MNVLGSRVDALTLAFRVTLDPAFSEALRLRAQVARMHGRASFEWRSRVTNRPGATAPVSQVLPDGSIRQVRGETLTSARTGPAIWGELRYSRAAKVWNITNEPFFRIHVDEQAPGASDRTDDETGEVITEGGWTVEVVFYAQWLADNGLERALAEALALAGLMGEVHEQRLRRIDLCADVAGWEIREDDVRRLAKRPRAKWSKEYGDGHDEDEIPAQDFGRGALDRRKLTGLSVGRGGAMMARIYDKRIELERDERRREVEEARWSAAGWDGVEPVTRIEFQIRGVAIAELGLRDPDVALEVETDEKGRAVAHRIATEPGPDGDGSPVVVGLVGRLDWLWRTCLDWVRLVVLERTRSGRLKPVSRLGDDPRWVLLRNVQFAAVRAPATIQRFRTRGVASCAQALGVTLSQAGREGALSEWSEEPEAYEETEALEVLTERVKRLKLEEVERIVGWLLDRYRNAVDANIHLAVRANAARLRFKGRSEDASIAADPAHGDGLRADEIARGFGAHAQGSFAAFGPGP